MADNDWKARLGMVYSTDPDYHFETAREEEPATLPPGVRAPRVVLGRGAVHAAEGADKQQYGHQPFHFPPAFLHRYPFCSRISTTRSRWSP